MKVGGNIGGGLRATLLLRAIEIACWVGSSSYLGWVTHENWLRAMPVSQARALAVPVEPASRLDGFATSIAIAGDAR